MKQKVRTILSGQIPVAVIFMILGLCLIFVPAATFNVISKVVFGVALILSGLYHVGTYCFPQEGTVSSALDLYPGVISMVLGIFLFTNPQLIRVLLPWVLGAFLIADCIWMIKAALKMKNLGIAMWEVLCVISAAVLILGIILIVNPFAQVRTMLTFAGWLMLVKGIVDLVLYIQVKKKVDLAMAAQAKKTVQQPDSYAMATVEPQRPAAPSFKQKWDQRNAEKKAARAQAREEARQREEAERAERIRKAQEMAREEELMAASMTQDHQAMDADFTQTEASGDDGQADDSIYDADFSESDVDEDEDENENA